MKILCRYDKLIGVRKLIPYPNNPNKHTGEQIERFAELLEYYGIRKPVVVSKQSGYIITGHCTVQAIKYNGGKEVPVEYQDFEDEDMEFGYVVADNGIAEWSSLEYSQINTGLEELDGTKFKLNLLGLKDFTLDPLPKEEKKSKKTITICPKCGYEWQNQKGKGK